MPTAGELLKHYLNDCYTMQLATATGEQPWICTVYFIADEQHNLYWASVPSRRHSIEITGHNQVAAAIVTQNTIGKPVIGMQIEGTAEVLPTPHINTELVQRYADKFLRNAKWVQDFTSGRTEHRLYKLTPSAIYLFDEEHFPGGKRQQAL